MKIQVLVFWVMTPCPDVVYQRFGWTYCPHLHGKSRMVDFNFIKSTHYKAPHYVSSSITLLLGWCIGPSLTYHNTNRKTRTFILAPIGIRTRELYIMYTPPVFKYLLRYFFLIINLFPRPHQFGKHFPEVISVEFWRWCISIERTVFLDFIHSLVSQEQTKLRKLKIIDNFVSSWETRRCIKSKNTIRLILSWRLWFSPAEGGQDRVLRNLKNDKNRTDMGLEMFVTCKCQSEWQDTTVCLSLSKCVA
jgi:hypothetical protein